LKNNLFQNRFKVTTLLIHFSCLTSSSSCFSSSFSFFPLMNLKRESHVICYSVLKENTVHPEMCSPFTHLLPSCNLRCIRLSFLRWTQTKVFRKINNLWECFIMQAHVFLKVEASNSTYSNNYSNPYDPNGWINVFWSETIRICKKNTKYFLKF